MLFTPAFFHSLFQQKHLSLALSSLDCASVQNRFSSTAYGMLVPIPFYLFARNHFGVFNEKDPFGPLHAVVRTVDRR